MAARQLPRRILSFLIHNQPSASPRVLFRREPISQILPVANSIFPRDGLCKRGLQTIAEASKQSAEESSIKLNSNTPSCASAAISNPAASDVSMGGHKVTSKLKQSSTNDGILPPNKSRSRPTFACSRSLFEPTRISDINTSQVPFSARSFASKTSESTKQSKSETRKDISAFEDPFDAPTDIIPEKPVTFTEGASYSLIILAGLGVAAAAAYAVFSELIFQPKEYKIFNKALKRIQDDGQVRVRIGSPITGYGSESRNRAARQRVPNRTWVDEDKVEHIEVNFYIRGPHGAGKVFTEMFKDKEDGEWKFMYLIVEITSPSRQQLILESYIPA